MWLCLNPICICTLGLSRWRQFFLFFLFFFPSCVRRPSVWAETAVRRVSASPLRTCWTRPVKPGVLAAAVHSNCFWLLLLAAPSPQKTGGAARESIRYWWRKERGGSSYWWPAWPVPRLYSCRAMLFSDPSELHTLRVAETHTLAHTFHRCRWPYSNGLHGLICRQTKQRQAKKMSLIWLQTLQTTHIH